MAENPDAIVMDVRMPRKDGLSAMAELRHHATTRNIPIVIPSASTMDQRRALDVGADTGTAVDDVYTPPFEFQVTIKQATVELGK